MSLWFEWHVTIDIALKFPDVLLFVWISKFGPTLLQPRSSKSYLFLCGNLFLRYRVVSVN
ncbi:hypothetical protein J6590_037160 [Homalodisca vitripennis]|nr:hypothetical protein J6590_037160 [Homalodisca vitripennis]